MIDSSGNLVASLDAFSTALSGHEVTLETASFLAFVDSLVELFSGLLHELIVAAVRRAATLWLLSCGYTVAAL